MKSCPYCGAEYSDDATACVIDQTPLTPEAPPTPAPGLRPAMDSPREAYELTPLTAEQQQQDWVTLVSCGTLMSADLIVSRLRAAEIEAFIPDASLAQAIGYNLGAVGYVRVQVAPGDYEAAIALLNALDQSD